jgi:hypothetical protein
MLSIRGNNIKLVCAAVGMTATVGDDQSGIPDGGLTLAPRIGRSGPNPSYFTGVAARPDSCSRWARCGGYRARRRRRSCADVGAA